MQANNEGSMIFFILIYSECYKHLRRFVEKFDEKWRATPTRDRQQATANKNENPVNTDCCEKIRLFPSVPPKIYAASPHPHRDQQGDLARSAGIEGNS
jgi:hypothetical protein